MRRIVHAADLFCGAGGTSTGLVNACHETGRTVDLLAVNHWQTAIESHRLNHPEARRICDRLEAIRPEIAVPGGRLDILVASPECTHHSIARGGRPVSDQLRASAWLLLRWLETLRVDSLLIENVREFRNWGPTSASGKPLKSRKGETYQAFLNALRSFGYTVEDRILNAADYGDATTRERLFILARKGKKRITWPKPTHGAPGLFGERKPYRTAREIIDWDLKGQSIFGRKKPLAPATMARIAAGLKKFGGKNAEPFLVIFYGTNNARSVDRPLATVTASGQHMALCEPFILGQQSCAAPRTVDAPLPTIATKGEISLIEPFLCTINHGGDKRKASSMSRSVDKPLGTLTTKNGYGLVEVTGEYQIDIRFRMLQPHELAAAMSLDGYKLKGTKGDQVKQIGNAVPARLAQALCRALLEG